MSNQTWDIVVVGGGPAGMAAAVSAATRGSSVLLVDDNPALGGQIWRGEESNPSLRAARKWSEGVKRSAIEVLRGFRIFEQPRPGILLAESSDAMREIVYSRLILCTGARERFAGKVAFLHSDIGTGDDDRNARFAEWLGPHVLPLLAKGAIVASDQRLPALEESRAKPPAGVAADRYYLYRVDR